MPLPVPNPRTFQPTEVEAAAYLNSVRDGLGFLVAEPVAVLTQSTVQALANNSATAITCDATTVDTYGGHSNTVNNSRYTAIVTGWYWLRPGAVYAANAAGDRGIQGYKNGTAIAQSWNVGPAAGAAFATGREVNGLVFLNAGDYVEGFAIQTSGGALNTFSGATAMSSLTVYWLHN